MRTSLFALFTVCLPLVSPVNGEEIADVPVDLNIAIFSYLPDAAAAIERLEEEFERKHNNRIDIDFELWNPYKDTVGDDGLDQMQTFDVVEIDVCRIQDLIAGQFGGIEELPVEMRRESGEFVGPAKSILKLDIGKYVIPHWVCGNFLMVRGSNKAAASAESFEELLTAMCPDHGRPLHAGMAGKTGLGEYYADALCDYMGPDKAREHLIALADSESPSLDPRARACVIKLAGELAIDNRKQNREHFYNHSYVHPRRFASQPESFLLGYSERLYYAERESQLTPGAELPVWKSNDVVVRQFPFAEISRGTPCWTDGFVVPKGKLSTEKRDAIEKFLEFVTSSEGYLVFAEPTPYLAAAYLLPAVDAAYSNPEIQAKQPILAKFKPIVDEGFSIHEVKVWQGMRTAGGLLDTMLNQ